ncbi:MAG: hypothetical protein PHO32_06480 [Candidatus Cloacimonetes bacterium]|nr:hypothetical protein [Candidatus Cloacimonadota bacterium]
MKKLVSLVFLAIITLAAWGQILGQQQTAVIVPVSRQEEFAKYIKGGYLMSASYYYFLNPGEDVENLQAASLSALKLSLSSFARQPQEAPSFVVSLGLLDNVAGLQGNLNGSQQNSYFVDFVSLYGGWTAPVLDYGAYFNVGAKGIVFYQNPVFSEFKALNSDFVYAHDFVIKDSTRTVVKSRPIGLAAEASARIGVKVYKSWFASLALGMRFNSSQEGKWYLKSDVQGWENGDDNFLPEYMYWTDASFPKRNYFLNGTNLFAYISISPFF